jgi:hypothetical protein
LGFNLRPGVSHSAKYPDWMAEASQESAYAGEDRKNFFKKL